jgi:malonyl-CoA/methylmalonyl-CoA synthetase
MSANCFALVRRACATPDKPLIESQGRRFTCRDTLLLTGRLANILVLNGVEPDDRVLVQPEPTPEHVMLFLAVLRAGGVYVSVDKIDALEKLDAKVVVCPSSMRDTLSPLAEQHVAAVQTLDASGGGMLMEAASKAPSDFADVPREENDLAAIFHVLEDGRAARLTHGELSARAKTLIDEGRLIQLVTFGQN